VSITITHEFLLADTEDERLEVTVEKDGSIRLMWWEEALLRGVGGKSEMGKTMRNLHIQRADFEQIAATVEAWDDLPIKKGLSNA
jgi:hypothetical protein